MVEQYKKERKMYMRVRNLCGILGVVLPWLALFSAGVAEHPSTEWWWSISATYYQSPAGGSTMSSLVSPYLIYRLQQSGQLDNHIEWYIRIRCGTLPMQGLLDT